MDTHPFARIDSPSGTLRFVNTLACPFFVPWYLIDVSRLRLDYSPIACLDGRLNWGAFIGLLAADEWRRSH